MSMIWVMISLWPKLHALYRRRLTVLCASIILRGLQWQWDFVDACIRLAENTLMNLGLRGYGDPSGRLKEVEDLPAFHVVIDDLFPN